MIRKGVGVCSSLRKRLSYNIRPPVAHWHQLRWNHLWAKAMPQRYKKFPKRTSISGIFCITSVKIYLLSVSHFFNFFLRQACGLCNISNRKVHQFQIPCNWHCLFLFSLSQTLSHTILYAPVIPGQRYALLVGEVYPVLLVCIELGLAHGWPLYDAQCLLRQLVLQQFCWSIFSRKINLR